MAPTDEQNEDDDDAEAAPLTALGEFMQRRNAELGLSVAAVAKRVGMSRATWYRIARGESASPGVRLLRGLARVYKVPAAELFALAAHFDAPPIQGAPVTKPGPGDALWRCRHARIVQAGTRVDVELELLNLSDRPWRRAEVRSLHDAWLPLADDEPRPRRALVDGHAPLRCRVALPPADPGDWVRAPLALPAPSAPGAWVLCLALHLDPSAPPAGAGAWLVVETA